MMRIKLVAGFRLSLRNLLLMAHAKLSTGMKEVRIEHKKKEEDFTRAMKSYKEPFGQFDDCFDEACKTPDIKEPRAMCLATCTRSGIPSARFVIFRGYSKEGFKFFTNYYSRKGKELNENPNAALVFYWESLRRSIRIEGTVKKLSDEEATQFFYSRPRRYQIEAAFSDQSQPISCLNSLIEKEKQFASQFHESDLIPKPKKWGGFILKPHAIEFWLGHNDGLHDRIRFRVPKEDEIVDNVHLHLGENGWVYERLQP